MSTPKIIYLGLCFTVLFSSDFTVLNMQKIITYSIKAENPSYDVDGYVSLGLTYSVYGIFLWLAPSIISVTGTKIGLVLGSLSYIVNPFALTGEIVWLTYLGMVIAGIGGSILWVAEGNYMIVSSRVESLPKNVGIFWAFFSFSFIIGNLYAVFQLQGSEAIEYRTRHILLYTLGGIAVIATVMFLFIPAPKMNEFSQMDLSNSSNRGPFHELKKTFYIFIKQNTLILLLTFIYTGFQQSFGQGILSSCIGFTKKFGVHAKAMVPLSGLIYGIGDFLGGALQIYLPSKLRQHSYWSISVIAFGFIFQLVGYILFYINIPSNAIFGETDDISFLFPRISLAMISAFLVGTGDSCLNTQIYPLLALLEPENSAQTCALYKFTKSMAMAVCFFASPYLGLHTQLLIISLFGFLSTFTFIVVKRRVTEIQ